jgi:hypothetical protein
MKRRTGKQQSNHGHHHHNHQNRALGILKTVQTAITGVFEDNNGALATARAVKMTPTTKRIAVKYHFFKAHVGPGTGIELVKIDTNLQKADIFTNGLAPDKFATMNHEASDVGRLR